MSVRAVTLLAALAVALALGSVAEGTPWSWLGVRIRDLSEPEMNEISRRHGLREGFGVMIVEVMEDTPAARAGMRTGDIVVAFEGRPVTETRLLQRLVARAPAEREIRLTVLRPEGREQLPVRLVAMPEDVFGERVAAEYGFVLREPPGAAEPGGQPTTARPRVGLVVRDSTAQEAGLEVGDVIVTINDSPILTRDEARLALARIGPRGPLRLGVRRGEELVTVTIAPPTS